MAIQIQCRCGRSIKVRDSAAGKRVRCPECQKPVKVPEPELDEVEEVFDDEAAAYGDDAYGSSYDEDYDAGGYEPAPAAPRSAAARRRRNAGGRQSAGRKKAKRKKASGSGLPTAVIIVAAILGGSVAIGGALYLALGALGDNGPVVADSADTDSAAAGNVNHNSPNQSATNGKAAAPSNSSSHDAAAAAANAGTADSGSSSAVADGGSSSGNSNAAGSDRLWVQLSDFKIRSAGGIARSYQLSYRVVSGQADPNKNYVLYVGTSLGSVMERYIEVDVIPQGSGSVPFDLGMGMGSNLKAYMALKKGHQDWQPVSAEIAVGGDPTTAQRPPTIQEAAGAGAEGMMLALANPRFERGRVGRNALVVDFVLQQSYRPGQNYYLVIEGNSGQPIASRVSTSFMRMKAGDSDRMGVSLIGPGNFPSGALQVYVEIRKGMRNRDGAERVSNVVTLNR